MNPEAREPSLSRAASRLIELVTLQGRLFIAEAKQSALSARTALALAGAALVLCLAAAPLALAAVALLLRDSFELSLAAALAVTAGAGVAGGVALGYAAFRCSSEAFAVIARTYSELEENLRSLAPGDDPAAPPTGDGAT